MDKYIYDGPVMLFDVCLSCHWKGETMAKSEAKARSNLIHQFKKQTNRNAGVRVTLPGKIIKIDRKDE